MPLSVQEEEPPNDPVFVEAVQRDDSPTEEARTELSEPVSVAATSNGTEPIPVESAESDAGRDPHESAEPKPEVTT